ncbi:MAG: hypothetical protein RIE73_29610 [Coleofasciculus sp. C1-SOL-03]|uniref:hypothetical protein n=1 Tax=Coleofasciculus sp. C1-SOL-03 TaxID=3069522 RepID=UPI0032F7C086
MGTALKFVQSKLALASSRLNVSPVSRRLMHRRESLTFPVVGNTSPVSSTAAYCQGQVAWDDSQ